MRLLSKQRWFDTTQCQESELIQTYRNFTLAQLEFNYQLACIKLFEIKMMMV